MATSVRLNSDLVLLAQAKSQAENRTVPKQIEYWVKIGRIAEDNPDLSYESIKDILQATSEINSGLSVPYQRRDKKC